VKPALITALLCGALTLASCLGGGAGSRGIRGQNGGQNAATAGASGPGAGAGAVDLALAAIVAPHEALLTAERWVQLPNASGGIDSFFERLDADGQGGMRLQLKAGVGPGGRSFQPTPEQIVIHESRQRFLLRYRDFRIRDLALLKANYDCEEVPGVHTAAGRDARNFRLVSKFGFGRAELEVDRATNVLLGWSWFNAAGTRIERLETMSVDFAPDHTGVQWSSASVNEEVYEPSLHEARLGFSPLRFGYAPQGFTLVREGFFDAPAAGLGFPALYLAVLSDGMNVVLVAQQQGERKPGTPPIKPRMGYTLSHSFLGGVRVLEGEPYGRRAFVVGSMSKNEMIAILSSLRP